eukprot:12055231-Ditylum_brightwellii.AAC.1
MSFILNPYNTDLNLNNKDDRKLFAEATKGLPEGRKFDGKIESFPNIAKFVGHLLRDFRLEEILRVAVKWSNATNVKDPSKIVDIFVTNGTPPEKMREYADLIWATTGKGTDTPKHFKKYGATELADTPALEADRNTRRLKHLMLGKLLWNSFAPDFQIEMLTKEKRSKRGKDLRETQNSLLSSASSKRSSKQKESKVEKSSPDIPREMTKERAAESSATPTTLKRWN